MSLIDDIRESPAVAAACRTDGEFALASRHWTGGVRLEIGEEVSGVSLLGGSVVDGVPEAGDGVVVLRGPADVWAPMLEPVPAPFKNSLHVMMSQGLERLGDELTFWQWAPAIERLIELMRPADADRVTMVMPTATTGQHDAPVGHYVHLEIGGADHRIYYEEAGSGIPILMQHTAGAHGTQYRHLFEMSEITDHFRLIAYDLPFHGKSIPPVGTAWWDDEYRLEGEFLRQIPVGLAGALNLDQPVFMGCSVGGLLALDLALHHPDVFRAVISLEGALNVGGDWHDGLLGLWHPQVSNQTKARMMEGLCAPQSPLPWVKEVSQVYSAGWPPAFKGDLWYYIVDFDIRERAHEIDTSKVGVHIVNGTYDWSGAPHLGLAAHEAIAGSTHALMDEMGHFPMQENPELFATHLLPILDAIGKGA